jgi:ABC-type branched-subunit amino acid transport system ATPase component/ABC-type branched-subunit amino acid transport system permease subunit
VTLRRGLGRRLELVFVVGLIGVVALLPEGLPLGIAGVGVVAGSILGLHAVAIVLLYSRTRILSFAQFGLGAFASVMFYLWIYYNQWAVVAHGMCGCIGPRGASMSRLQHNPDVFRAYLQDHHPWMLILNVLISAGLGILLAVVAGRNGFFLISVLFARAPRIVPTVATLAFALTSAGAVAIVTLRTAAPFGRHAFEWFPYGPRHGTGFNGVAAQPEGTFHAPLGDAWTFRLSGGAQFHFYDVLAVVGSLAALVAITMRFHRGRRGLASRATAANPERAATLGVDVMGESMLPWKVAGALSGLAGVLAVAQSASAPVVGLDMGGLTLVLAAVVLARLTSPGVALAASVVLGVLQQGMFWNFHSQVQFQGSLVVIVGVALVLQRGRATRAEKDAESVFTTAPEPLPVADRVRRTPGVQGFLRSASVAAGVVLIGYPLVTSPGQLSLGITTVSFMVMGLSLLVVAGWGGQVSLGQLAIAAVGAYVAAIAGVSWHVPLPLALLLGGAAGTVIAPLVGLPALRLPGPFVAIMTLAFALAVPAVLLNVELLGDSLPANLPRPVLLGVDLHSDRYYYWFCLLVLSGCGAIVAGLRRSRLRRTLIAARDNQDAAAAFGVDITRLRLEGFAVSGFLAGVGGGLLAFANSSVAPESFSAANSVVLFLIVVIGGLSAASGPVLGAVLYSIAQLAGPFFVAVVNGFGTIIVLAVRPGGIASIVTGLRDACVRVILHLQGNDPVRSDDGARVAIVDRGAQAEVVPVRYRLVGDGYGPVEGTRLRPVEGVGATDTSGAAIPAASMGAATSVTSADVPALSCHRLDVAYGGATALSGISLELAPGEVLAVVGLNGAGKTSLLRALAGLEPAAHGTVELGGVDVTMVFPQERARLGVAFVPGGAAVLATLTVRENLVIAGAGEADIADACERFPVLGARLDTAAGNLSGGEQQVLALAQAALRVPRVLLVDEMSLGLSPEALATVLGVVADLARNGTAVILVEQSISTAMELADSALFLESGRVRYQGPASALRDHPELFSSVALGAGGGIGSVGGGSEIGRARAQLQAERDVVLRVEGLSASYGPVTVVDSVDLEVAAGEVIGVLGPNGAGKTSLFDCISGILPPTRGTITLLGDDITDLPPHRRAQRGLMRSFQSVRLFPSLIVRDCIAVALETRLEVKSAAFAGLWLPPARASERRVDERVAVLLELLSIEALADTPLGSLSLGSRRLVDLACQLAARPKVLLLDEPAAGLAQGETEVLGPLVSRISSDLDCAVLIIEHNVQVLASVADRLVAMRDGAVIATGAPADVLADPAVRDAYFGARRTLDQTSLDRDQDALLVDV